MAEGDREVNLVRGLEPRMGHEGGQGGFDVPRIHRVQADQACRVARVDRRTGAITGPAVADVQNLLDHHGRGIAGERSDVEMIDDPLTGRSQ